MSTKRKGAITSAVTLPRRVAAGSKPQGEERSNPAAPSTLSTKTSLSIDDSIYDRAIAFKTSVRRTAKRRMSDIVNTALDEYLKRQGF